MPSLPVVEDEDSASKVLMDEYLVGDILKCLHCPTCFVRAALIRKNWLRNAASQNIIHNFCSRQSPHLLGAYIYTEDFSKPEFVPLADSLSPELGGALRHGNFRFDNMDTFFLHVWDCRNGRVLYGFSGSFKFPHDLAVRMPLHPLGQETSVLPPQPPTTWQECPHAMFLPDEDGDESSCYRLDIAYKNHTVYARVFVLKAETWATHSGAMADLIRPPKEILTRSLLMNGKIYMLTMAGYILALHLANWSFFTVDLPGGVEYEYSSNLALCRGDNSVLYLFHLKEDKLFVWMQRMNDHLKGDKLIVSTTCLKSMDGNNAATQWILSDTISLHETCGHLRVQGCMGDVSVVGVGDNAEFVFLEFEENGIIVYMHIKSRKVKVVYQRGPDNDIAIRVLPFMMVWPVVLPKFAAGESKSEGLHQE
ncbi:unnamed protein product [Urochloa decumbens]|uniref:F-box protein AT5G49610-like beta-propeller domain-containing protein n=1 Tax=Urochloa decumbens TaxID=240449 RepID=A0ABC8VDU9_9POAL